MSKYFGKGIPVASGFDLNSKTPLDARTVVQNLEQAIAMPDIQKYNGLMIYNEETKSNYQWIDNNWEPVVNIGLNEGQIPVLSIGGKLPVSTLPAITINEFFPVNSKEEAMALDLQIGDGVILEEDTYLCINITATVFDEKFKHLQSGSDTVTKALFYEELSKKSDNHDHPYRLDTWLPPNDHVRSHTMTSTSDHKANAHKMFYSDSNGNVQEIGLGNSGQVLKSNGNAAPTWQTDNNTASATDNLLKASNSGTVITYAPYSEKLTDPNYVHIYNGETAPTGLTKLNINATVRATQLYDNNKRVSTVDHTHETWKIKLGTETEDRASIVTTGSTVTMNAGTNVDLSRVGSSITINSTNTWRPIDSKPTQNNDISIASSWAYTHQNTIGVSGHIPANGAQGQFLSHDGTWKTPSNTASALDDILDGSNQGTTIKYMPYTTQQNNLSFDTSSTDPHLTQRLNLNGHFHATNLYVKNKEVALKESLEALMNTVTALEQKMGRGRIVELIERKIATIENQKEFMIDSKLDLNKCLIKLRVGSVMLDEQKYNVVGNSIIINADQQGIAKGRRADIIIQHISYD